jgi:putative glycosyltransferase
VPEMDLSIVTTLYYSAPYIMEFYNRIITEVERITSNYEIILVNDGSPDNSLDIAVSLYEKDSRVKVIDFSRNFGHHKAMMTGLAQAKGELVFLIDVDLEEEPELLGKFYDKFKNTDIDVLYGVQQRRKGGSIERIFGEMFYRIFNLLSYYPIPSNIITARLMSQRYVKNLVEHKDREIFMAGLWAITGFKQMPVFVNKLSKGSSTYNFSKKISLFVNSITSFSNKPLIFIFYIGFLITFLSGIGVLTLVIRRLFFGIYLEGWSSMIVSIWLLGGLVIFFLGVIGIYLSKIFTEAKQRPYTVIRHIYEHT